VAAQSCRGGFCSTDSASTAVWTGGRRGVGAGLEDAQPDLCQTPNPFPARYSRNPGRGRACATQQRTPRPASLDERGYRRSSPTGPSLHSSPRPFDHQSGSLAQTADSDPHLRKVGTRPNQAFWRSIWSPTVEGDCRVAASIRSR